MHVSPLHVKYIFMISLRPYQLEVKTGIYQAYQEGCRNVIAVMPTGAGKSVLVSDIALDNARANRQQAIIAHRNELVAQLSMHLADRGIPHRIIAADKTVAQIMRKHRKKYGRSYVNHTANTAVIGVDTLIARQKDLADWLRQVSFWCIDEGHHVLAMNKWGKAVSLMPNAWGLGVSASPARPDGMGLGAHNDGVYHKMVLGIDMRSLINNGSLTDYEIACPESLHMDDDDIGENGEYKKDSIKKKVEKSRIVGDVVDNYILRANGKRAICFATSVEKGGEIAAKFNEKGIRSACLSAKTPSAVREKYLDEFESGKLLVLVNVDLFDEGFDVPACEVVIMARPTASLIKYLQMFGRALRPCPGKRYALIIDHVGNIKRHKFPDRKHLWNLERAMKRGKKEKHPEDVDLIHCKNVICNKPYEIVLAACPHCGYAPPLPEPKARTIEQVEGDLLFMDVEQLAKMREAMEIESIASLGGRVRHVAGDFAAKGAINKHLEKMAAQQKLIATIDQWAGYQQHLGRDWSQSYRRFHTTVGMDVLSACAANRSREDYEKLTAQIEGWYATPQTNI